MDREQVIWPADLRSPDHVCEGFVRWIDWEVVVHAIQRDHSNASVRWHGRACIGAGWASFLGTAGDNHPHAHHAVQVVTAFGPPVTVWTPASGSQSIVAAVIPNDQVHALLPSDTPVGLLYIDAESTSGRSLSQLRERAWLLPDIDTVRIRQAFERATAGHPEGFAQLLAGFAFQAPIAQVDPRVSAVVERLHTEEHLDRTLAEIAAWAHLSPSRFAHRFRLHTGMPLRPYLRWLRLQRAAAGMVSGASATIAAHAAGFADAAHLSRTFRRHFGIHPSVLTNLANS